VASQRVFVTTEQIQNNRVSIVGSDVHYIAHVLRLKPGDAIDILDDRQRVYATVIEKMEKGRIYCTVKELRNLKSEPFIKVTIAQGIPKGKKMDQIIRQTTELGVHAIIPMHTERSIPKLDGEKREEKRARWQKIAKEAAEQSGRLLFPSISLPQKFSEVLARAGDFSAAILFWEGAEKTTLKHYLQSIDQPSSILIIIGPEGGFSRAEVEEVRAAQIPAITIGRRVLRTETAPIVALAMILYALEL